MQMIFDKKKLKLKSLKERLNDLDMRIVKPLERSRTEKKAITETAKRIVEAKRNEKAVIIMLGGHVIRAGVQRFLIDLMEKGYIDCLAMNGSVMIHDYEFALNGATTESVARYIIEGQFGLWEETGRLNDIIKSGYENELGMGEAVGKALFFGNFPHKDISVLAAAYRLKIPATVHVGIGYDIIHEHPNCDGAATGATSYKDFLYFAKVVENLEGGVVMNFGSAVMAPEVFLKALSMARNVAKQEGRRINRFTTVVCDLHDLPEDFRKEPCKEDCAYYFRPWKTMLVRTVADGGQSFYIKGRHEETIPLLWTAVKEVEEAQL